MPQPDFHLISHHLCPYVQRSVITLKEKNIPYLRTDIDLGNKPDWFQQKSPMGKVPVLIVNQKQTLFESAVICEYLDEVTPGSLHPTDKLERAYHRAWIEFGSGILNKISNLYNAAEASSFQAIHEAIQSKFQIIENELQGELHGSHFFSGDSFHLIDAAYGPIFRYFEVFDSVEDLGTFDYLPKCQLWHQALMQRQSIQQAVAECYPERLLEFLTGRRSYISQIIEGRN